MTDGEALQMERCLIKGTLRCGVHVAILRPHERCCCASVVGRGSGVRSKGFFAGALNDRGYTESQEERRSVQRRKSDEARKYGGRALCWPDDASLSFIGSSYREWRRKFSPPRLYFWMISISHRWRLGAFARTYVHLCPI